MRVRLAHKQNKLKKIYKAHFSPNPLLNDKIKKKIKKAKNNILSCPRLIGQTHDIGYETEII